ncbi:uncharacterized protein LOC105006821 isoform X2 [Esox lucius]|uniref:C-type lectin domain-containing protein n=1 Tax=Esox lucius TaxID=8010 RepID=A0A3P8ZIR4_ESOLU|nr:uncharacterized protein LOC105006821 isoform X2 [Esox lucius]
MLRLKLVWWNGYTLCLGCYMTEQGVETGHKMESDLGPPQVGSKGGSQRVTMVTLACLWILLFCLATAWVVLFVSNEVKDNISDQREVLSSELQFCEKNLTVVNNHLTTLRAKRCASGWEFYNGSCYHFSEDKLTWEQSQYACIRDGGHLVIIESQQEQDFIRMKVGNTEVTNSYWIGMTDIKVEGVWVWMDNTPLNNSIKYWDQNNGTGVSDFPEPNDWESNEDCAQMGQRCSGQISCWIDTPCNVPSKRICESHSNGEYFTL